MSRKIQVSLPPEETDKIISRVQKLEGLIGLRVNRNASILPKGDVLELDFTNPEVNNFLKLLEEMELLQNENVSITTSRPTNVISKTHSEEILSEPHETSWEDMLKNLLHQSNMSLNTLLVMFFAGMIATFGIMADSLHVVVGAMLIAPGFEPISRLVMGLLTKHVDWKNGAADIFKGYFLLIAGSIAAKLIIKFSGKDFFGSSSYLNSGVLLEYWSNISATSILVSIIASLAGGLIIMSNKSLLTAGVMVALALIPAGALLGIALVDGNFELAGKSAIKLLLEIGIVALFTGLIFAWKRLSTHRRNMHA